MKNTIIFIHIPRTAGTTLHNIIDRHYRAGESYSFGPAAQDSIAALMQLPPKARSKIKMIKGHMGYGLGEQWPAPTTYFTVLREPVDRTISFFYYVRNNQLHYLHTSVHELDTSLPDFVRIKKPVMLDNAQTRLMSGEWLKPPFGGCTRDMLEKAKQNLAQCSAIGLTERFDESLLLLKHAYGWKHLRYEKLNAAPRPTMENLDSEERAIATEINQLDIELYDYAQELFDEKIQRLGASFQRELKAFQGDNRPYPAWRESYWKVRSQPVSNLASAIIHRLPSI